MQKILITGFAGFIGYSLVKALRDKYKIVAFDNFSKLSNYDIKLQRAQNLGVENPETFNSTQANGGTLFLDEIGEMPVDLQSKLLRVLETGDFFKVGDTKPVKVNVRIITATNRNLLEEVNEGRFREDLYYRLNVFKIELPSLRERKEDISLLTDFYTKYFAAKSNRKIKSITKEALKLLEAHNWKGNIRELKNIIERAVILASTDHVTPESLPYDMQTKTDAVANTFDLSVMEKQHIQKTLAFAKGNKTEAARLLNIGLTTLYRKMEEYNIPK